MKFCYNTSFTLLDNLDLSFLDSSRFLGLFWNEKTLSFNGRNTVL